jgi:hypothetical protein
VKPFFRALLLLALCASCAIALTGCPEIKVRAEASKLKAQKDPIRELTYKWATEVRTAYNSSQFDELESIAKQVISNNEIFENGRYKISEFHSSLDCRKSEPISMWERHDQIHRDWIAAKPDSITARVAYARFLTEYAWHARGSGWSNEVTEEGWRLFEERLEGARKVLEESKALARVDPFWWVVALSVALGQGWERSEYDNLVNEAIAAFPKFHQYDELRAHSLLPRWHGERGDWEKYAANAAARPDGVGAEIYARIVIYLDEFYDNIFRESNASWDMTKSGIRTLVQRHPNAKEFVAYSAKLAVLAKDREFARTMFDALGSTYYRFVWSNPETFVRCKKWALAR